MSIKSFLFTTTAVALLLPAVAMADDTASAKTDAAPAKAAKAVDPKSPVTHEEFSSLLREALMNDPEMLIEAVKGVRDKQRAQADMEVQKSLEKFQDDLLKDKVSPSIGDPKTADVTVIEFFDYHCGYCKRMFSSMAQLTQDDPKVRVIFREFPILSEDSTLASRAALAVNKLYPGKYFAFHSALMSANGEFNDTTLAEIAKKQALDWGKIKKEMDGPDVKSALEKNHALADELGIRGTPALIIGKQFIPGAIPYEQLKKAVADVRAGKSPTVKAQPEASHEENKAPK